MTAGFQTTAPPMLPQELQGRLTLNPRGFRPFHVETINISPTEQAFVFTGGINAVIQEPGGEPIDILADRMVLWTRPLSNLAEQQGERPPLQLYLEGNVIFRQGDRTAEMEQLFYDADRHAGVATNATLYAYHEKLRGPVFVRARRLRQVAENIFVGQWAQITPSRFPLPTYALEADRVVVEEEMIPLTNMLTGQPITDPETGQPSLSKRRWITSERNVLRFLGFPVFYWPYLQGPLDEAGTPLRSVRFRQSRSFGTEVHTYWNVFRLFGRQQPEWIDHWDLQAGYMSRRGPVLGTDLEYAGPRTLWLPGNGSGLLNAWWIQDHGKDRLGRGRNNMPIEQDLRGRMLFRHRHNLPFDLTMHLEGSWISDINFLEQYFEQEWEEGKDQETLLYLKQQRDNWSWSLLARRRVLDFVPSTDYLPRLDWFLTGEPLLGNRLTYYMHTNAAYMNFLVADRSFGDITVFPDAPATVGSRFDTLHELDMPLAIGSVRVVPYAVGRYTAWSETLAAVVNILAGASRGIPDYVVEKAERVADVHRKSIAAFYKAGGRIAMGTDAGTPFNMHG
ncbi:MAG TPA: hypothetical protein EYP14_04385, partial [Planctomycetaceae bacterium]|nr:hypothetical protein [Planctomycetaceae bacterium]